MTIKKLPAACIKLDSGGLMFNQWFGIVEADISVADIYTPSFWMHYRGSCTTTTARSRNCTPTGRMARRGGWT